MTPTVGVKLHPRGRTLACDAGGLELRVTFATELFDVMTVDRWSDYLMAGLARVVANPAQRADRLDFLPPREREWLVHGVNPTATIFPVATTSVHRLFEI